MENNNLKIGDRVKIHGRKQILEITGFEEFGGITYAFLKYRSFGVPINQLEKVDVAAVGRPKRPIKT
jgi:hypothetical protein